MGVVWSDAYRRQAEDVLFFAHGREAAGKSTSLEALKATLGAYAGTADFETFLSKRGDAADARTWPGWPASGSS